MECLIEADQPNISAAGTFATLETLRMVLSHQCHIRKVRPLNTISMCLPFLDVFCFKRVHSRQRFGVVDCFVKLMERSITLKY